MISSGGKLFRNLPTILKLTLLIFHPKPSSHRNKNISSKLVFLTKYPQQVHTVFKGYFEVRKVSMTLKIPFSMKQQNVSNALIWENWIAGWCYIDQRSSLHHCGHKVWQYHIKINFAETLFFGDETCLTKKLNAACRSCITTLRQSVVI